MLICCGVVSLFHSLFFRWYSLLIGLGARVALPAHGPPNFRATALLETYLKHRQAREDAILAALMQIRTHKHTSTASSAAAAGDEDNSMMYAEAIVKEVYKDVPASAHKLALRNVELHLRKLKMESKYWYCTFIKLLYYLILNIITCVFIMAPFFTDIYVGHLYILFLKKREIIFFLVSVVV